MGRFCGMVTHLETSIVCYFVGLRRAACFRGRNAVSGSKSQTLLLIVADNVSYLIN